MDFRLLTSVCQCALVDALSLGTEWPCRQWHTQKENECDKVAGGIAAFAANANLKRHKYPLIHHRM